MLISSLNIKNFRCFNDIDIALNKKCTILIGSNGAGKSSILDALAIGLGSYIAGLDAIGSKTISKEDAHYKMYELGSIINREAQYPVELGCTANFRDKDISWKRALNGKDNRTTIGDARVIIDIAKDDQERIRAGDTGLVLPLIAYYGTGRLWMQKRERKNRANSMKSESRVNGYLDCLDAASNEKLMLKWFEKMTYLQLQQGQVIPELEVVKSAMAQCYKSVHPEILDVQCVFDVKSHDIEITTKKKCPNGQSLFVEKLPLRLLSDGIKSTLSMVADIAYRMAVLNPQLLENVLSETPGVVLIDELDMHLHPAWQKKIVSDLCTIFPKVQFVCTTHAPSILANVPKEYILLLDDYKAQNPSNATYGRDINAILREIMGVDVRPAEVSEMIKQFYTAIDSKKFTDAKVELQKLLAVLGENDADFIAAQISLDLEELG